MGEGKFYLCARSQIPSSARARVCAVCASTCLAYLSHVRSHVSDRDTRDMHTPVVCGFLAVLSALFSFCAPGLCLCALLAAAACGRVASRVCGCGDGRVMVYVMDMVVAVCPVCRGNRTTRNANQTVWYHSAHTGRNY